MVAMAVGDDDVLDPRRIETEAAQAALDQLGGFLAGVEGVDQDDAVGRGDRPGADPLGAARPASSPRGRSAGAGLQSASICCRSLPAARVAASTWLCTIASVTGGAAGVQAARPSRTPRRPGPRTLFVVMAYLPLVAQAMATPINQGCNQNIAA
jgi:hypothetical protein